MPTDKSTRAAPPRVFENYTLSLIRAPGYGLSNVDERMFRPCSPSGSVTPGVVTDPGLGDNNDGMSAPISIGFDFGFDGRTYKKFCALTNGWMALVAPNSSSFEVREVLSVVSSSDNSDNSSIRSTFTSNAVLLAPWFHNGFSVAASGSQLVADGFWSATKEERQRFGIEPRSPLLDNTRFGVRCANFVSERGRALAVRWHSKAEIAGFRYTPESQAARFECVLYEDGTIEFRYARYVFDFGNSENIAAIRIAGGVPADGTIGIFMPGGTHRFRDFSYGLGHRDTERQTYRYGGATYSSAYQETHGSTVNYTTLLQRPYHWPGLNNSGATYVFSPPKNPRKVLPRLALRTRDASTHVPAIERAMSTTTSGFDDRKTLLASTIDGRSIGTITTIGASLLMDGETFVLNDGVNPIVTFEFDNNASVIASNTLRPVPFAGTEIADQVRDLIITAINTAPALNITAWTKRPGARTNDGTALVNLVNDIPGSAGNQAITDTVFATGFMHTGMSSGFAAVARAVFTGSRYPTTLDTFYGYDTPLREEMLDLFVDTIDVTGSTSRIAPEDFVKSTNNNVSRGREFNEATVLTSSPDALFANSGSYLEQLGLGMSQPVSAKTKVRLTLAVNNSMTMFTTASSIYYYNKKTMGWNIPQGSSYIIANTATGSNGSSSDIANVSGSFVSNDSFFEDARGFNALGGVVSSGSMTPVPDVNESDLNIGAPYNRETLVDTLCAVYSKSVQINSEYAATPNETILLPISRPFVIEKVVFEVPIAAGPGWFNDVTQMMQPIESTDGIIVTDLAGPALTISLFNQISPTRRDLIASGTITHTLDNTSNIVFENFPPLTSTYHIRQKGFRSFDVEPSAVIAPTLTSGSNLYFTGSVVVPTTAQISNGVTVFLHRSMNFDTPTLMRSGVLALFNSPKLVLSFSSGDTYLQSVHNVFINGFGRGASGFEPSGRSVFGKEFTTNLGVDSVVNPFYVSGAAGGLTLENLTAHVSGGNISSQFSSSLTTGSTFVAYTPVSLNRCLPSPYLVYPGDNLVIAVSKTRPAFYGDATPITHTSGSILHDIQLVTGSLGVTFYGSYLKEGAEYHETFDAQLDTTSIHEINVGGDPVLDQFEVEYAETYSGSMSDDYVTGSLVTSVATFGGGGTRSSTGIIRTLVTGSRGRVFSMTNPHDVGFPQTTSVAYNSQPWSEFAGMTRVSQCVSVERYFDSMMPALETCFSLDNSTIGLFDSTGAKTSLEISGTNLGFVVLDDNDFGGAVGFNSVNNPTWSWAYPFEPRYSTASRLIDVKKSFVATANFSGLPITPRPTEGLVILYAGDPMGDVVDPVSGLIVSKIVETGSLHPPLELVMFADANTINNCTSSMSNEDAIKVLYGFGDVNTVHFVSSSGIKEGNNHFASYHKRHNYLFAISGLTPPGSGSTTYHAFAPIIRGWKYGVHSGLPSYSKAYFRTGHFGQFRDMLEQRPFTKYYQSVDINNRSEQASVKQAAVNIIFVSSVDGRLTLPENTWSSNLSFEATSSLPYFDNVSRNRGDIDLTTLNSSVLTF